MRNSKFGLARIRYKPRENKNHKIAALHCIINGKKWKWLGKKKDLVQHGQTLTVMIRPLNKRVGGLAATPSRTSVLIRQGPIPGGLRFVAWICLTPGINLQTGACVQVMAARWGPARPSTLRPCRCCEDEEWALTCANKYRNCSGRQLCK